MLIFLWALPIRRYHLCQSSAYRVISNQVYKGDILMAVALKFDMLALFAAVAFVGAVVFGAF
jgi:hypothetical protein